VRVDAGREKQFGDFAAFDLSLDSPATSILQHIRSAVPASDIIGEQLTCLWHLVCLEPNPDAVSRFLERSFPLLAELERTARATRSVRPNEPTGSRGSQRMSRTARAPQRR
jgi:hypothetical protein